MLSSSSLYGQSISVDTLRATQPWGIKESYTFPLVKVLGQEAISDSINSALFREYVNVDGDDAEDRSLKGLWGEPGSNGMARISSFRWSYTMPRPAIICIGFSGEYCGAYCEDFISHSAFDLNSGARIAYPALFTSVGQKMISDTLTQHWLSVMEDHISMLEHERAVTTVDQEEIARLGSTIDLYRNCLNERMHTDPYIQDMEPLDNLMRFSFSRCSNHFDRALDELAPLYIDLPYSTLIEMIEPGSVRMFIE